MKQPSVHDFQQELRISPRPVLALILIPATFLPVLPWATTSMSSRAGLAILLYVLVGASWLLDYLHPILGRWATLVTVMATVLSVNASAYTPGLLALLALPTGFAAAFLGLPAMLATAGIETVLLALLPPHWFAGAGQGEIVVCVIVIWAIVALLHVIYRPVTQLAGWSFEHFSQAQGLLETARKRQAELKDALSALAHANRELALVNEKLATMRLLAEEAQKTKAAFVANVSHELRTPLNIIIGLAEILLDAPQVFGERLPPHVRENLLILYRNCEHLASMINDVLDLSQVEAGRLALHKEWTDLPDLVQSALVVVQPLLDNKGLSLEVSIPEDLPRVHCDPTRIRQVVLNLMSNAARFTDEGGLRVRVARNNQDVLISVSDSGPGIAPEDVERIFEPFQQGSQSSRRQRGGSGLGLCISKQFVELHDGQMWLESQPGVGSTFRFRLPIAPPSAPIAPPERWITEGWVERTIRPNVSVPRLDEAMILCDETGELAPLFARYADDVDWMITHNLPQMLDTVKQSPVEAILVNARTPEELLPLLTTASSAVADTPIIGCTLPSRTEQALAAGAVGYLLKPLNRVDLERTIATLGRPIQSILLIDDDADTLWLLTQMLHAYDSSIELWTASSSAEALERLRRDRPSLILLDIVMPQIDGWQFMAIKAQDKTICDIPVIIVSAQDPRDRPLSSRVVMASMGEGLSVSRVLQCARSLAALLLQPDSAPHPAPEETAGDGPV